MAKWFGPRTETEREIMVAGQLGCVVAIYKRGLVFIADHQVEIAVVVEVPWLGRPVGKGRLIQPSGLALV